MAWLLGLLCCAAPVQAQTLDDIDVRMRADGPVVRIRFNASVRFLSMAPAGTADLYIVRLEFITADEAVLRQGSDEFRRLPAGAGLPEITVGYAAQPASRIKQLTVRLAQPLPLVARQGPNARSIELLQRTAETAPGPRFILALQTVPLTEAQQIRPLPDELQDLEALTERTQVDGVASVVVTVGTFTSVRAAEAALAIALPRFPQARIVDLSSGPGGSGVSARRAQGCISTAPGSPEVERDAAALLAQARQAIETHVPDAAVALLNQLLKLPPNSLSLVAQELIGNAWEQAGNPARARIEYQLYLRLCPQSEGAARVAQRLAALGPAGGPARTEPPKPWSGSLAQYYYGGRAQTKSLVNIATGIDQATLSRTTESSIVTSLDLSGRLVGEGGETRAVVRGSGATNLLSSGHSSSSIGAVYVEHRRTGPGLLSGLAVRAGRQSPLSGGMLGLFDGVSLAYPVGHGLKVDVMGGVPASPLISAPAEQLFAAVVEADTLSERWGGNFYVLQQSTQGITNRRALGAELRYAGEQWSLNTLLDYDSVFNLVNALSVHASIQAGAQTTVTMLVDERRAPSLQLTNALISSGADSLRTLLQTFSLAQIRDNALATSATARQFLLSVARPLSERWQASTDLRYSAVGALPAVGDFQATPATGGQISWSAQLTGTNLYSRRDINNFNLSVMTTPLFKGAQFSFNNLTAWPGRPDLTVEPSIRLYTQRDNQDTRLLRVGPGVRMSYRASPRASLLGEVLYEVSRTDGPINHDHSNSAFFYVGYRYELF